jgi:hypothetical protein
MPACCRRSLLRAAPVWLLLVGAGSVEAQCEKWLKGLGTPGMDNSISAFAFWDPDGDGPSGPQLVAAGNFVFAGGVRANGIARWDPGPPGAWVPFGSGIGGAILPYVYALTVWDPDGPGPQPAQLVAGGDFTIVDGVGANRIARWDPTQPGVVQTFGQGMNAYVTSLTTWDPDGDGPEIPQLVAGGYFTMAGGVSVNRIARWDPTPPGSWQPFQNGVNAFVDALTTWDPDGDGPLPPALIAGGEFTMAGAVPASRIARWDPTPPGAWVALGMGLSGGPVLALTTWDADGDAPQPPQLVAGGAFTSSGGATINHVARWSPGPPGIWLSFGAGFNQPVFVLKAWHPRGVTWEPQQLVSGGYFTSSGAVLVSYIARWNPSPAGWKPLGAGADYFVSGLTAWDLPAPAPQAPVLVVGGDFVHAGGMPSNYIATWTSGCVGDLNGDCRRDQSDLGLLLSAYQTCPGDAGYSPAAAALYGDACVDQSDLGVLLTTYGKPCPE